MWKCRFDRWLCNDHSIKETGMSTSVFYRALGIQGYQHQSIREQDGGLVMRVRRDGGELTCPHCGGSNIVRRGTVPRRWSTVPIGRKPVTVFAEVPRIECRDCRTQPVATVPFADARRSYTRSFERLVLELRESMTLQDVARYLGVSEWLVKDIEKRWLGKHFAKPRLKDLQHIAIDEIATKKGHKYLTIVMDLESGAVVFVGDGKGADALKPFWRSLKASHAHVEAVAIDMSAAYYGAVCDNLPDAAVVFDWFHIVKLLNEKLSELRRQLYREATDRLHKKFSRARAGCCSNGRRISTRLATNGTGFRKRSNSMRAWRPPTTSRKTCGCCGRNRRSQRRSGSSMTGFARPTPAASADCKPSPRRWRTIAAASSPGTTTPSRPVRWKGPTTRSKP